MSTITEFLGLALVGGMIAGTTLIYRGTPRYDAVPTALKSTHDRIHYPPMALDLANATYSGNLVEIERLLVLDPALCRYAFSDGSTALHLAAMQDDASVIRLLLRYGADVDARGAMGATPMHVAARNGSKLAVAIFIEVGADKDARCTAYGGTPILWAAFGSGEHSENRPGRWLEVVQLLIAAGAEADTRNKDNVSAIEMAAPDVASYLQQWIELEKGRSDPSKIPQRT